jgi:hypothetical protein
VALGAPGVAAASATGCAALAWRAILRPRHQRGTIISTPSESPAAKATNTTSTNGACQSVPKKKFTDTTCWLFSEKAKRVKNRAALATYQKQRHNRYQTFHAVLQDASPLGAKNTSKISLRFKHNVVCENHSQILTPFGNVIAQALFVVSHMLYLSASFIH